jgi:hypothetical protein
VNFSEATTKDEEDVERKPIRDMWNSEIRED